MLILSFICMYRRSFFTFRFFEARNKCYLVKKNSMICTACVFQVKILHFPSIMSLTFLASTKRNFSIR